MQHDEDSTSSENYEEQEQYNQSASLFNGLVSRATIMFPGFHVTLVQRNHMDKADEYNEAISGPEP